MKRALLLALLAGAAAAREPLALPDALEEVSGMARSLADPELLWAHNDSGNASVLYRLDLGGGFLGAVALRGSRLSDWEDLAAFRWQNQPALLLADIGDNFAARDHVSLYAVTDPGRGDRAELLWALDFRYPDGARDAEALAVDAAAGEILLLSKRDTPPRLYTLPLPGGSALGPVQTATQAGEVRSIPPADAAARRRAGRLRAPHLRMPTALALSADGKRAVIVTADRALVYRRAPEERWLAALNRRPAEVPLPELPQIEAGALSADGRTLYIASEGSPPRFARIALPE